MSYLVFSDYRSYIQKQYFNQLVQGDDTKRIDAENKALAIVKGRLQQKYDVSKEFTDTVAWDKAQTYQARDRVILDYPAYSTSSTYAIDALVTYAGTCYICTTAVTVAETFNASKWSAIGPQYTIYFAKYPSTCTYPATLAERDAPVFDYKRIYNKGDIVFWKNKIYTSTRATSLISHESLINCGTYANVPHYNVFPDDAVNNASGQYWGSASNYTVPAGTALSNTAYWTKGDNRDAQLVLYMTWITVDLLAPLLAPENCPETWRDRADRALYEISAMAKGENTADAPLLQPNVGTRIRSGGNVKRQNWY